MYCLVYCLEFLALMTSFLWSTPSDYVMVHIALLFVSLFFLFFAVVVRFGSFTICTNVYYWEESLFFLG